LLSGVSALSGEKIIWRDKEKLCIVRDEEKTTQKLENLLPEGYV